MTTTVYSNKYEIQEEIAQGGMGIVYKAWDRMLERVVALKVIHQNLATDSNFLDRFLDEARKMALLQHPNIIQIYSVENDHDMPFLVMEYFPGDNLKTYLRNNIPLSLKESVHIVSQIAHALTFTHKKGIIHRDIKPANILLDNISTVKLTDFGIARALGQTAHTVTGQLLGTVKYMSPEQARDISLDGRSDLYSLGMLFYELVTGANPRNDLTAVGILSLLITEGHMPTLNFPASLSVPSEIQEIIIELLQFHPSDRIPNAESLIDRLEKSFSSEGPSIADCKDENTNETQTLSLAHSFKSGANKAAVFQDSSSSQSPNTDGDSGFEHQASLASAQNPSTIQLEKTSGSESQANSFLMPRYGPLVVTIALIMAIGGYAWNYIKSPQPVLVQDHQIATTPNIRVIKEEKTTLVVPDSKQKAQHSKEVSPEEFASPRQESLATLPSQQSQEASSTPSLSSVSPTEIVRETEESQAGPHHDIVSSSQVQSEPSPPLVEMPLSATAPNANLTPSDVSPTVSAKSAFPIEAIEEGSSIIHTQASQERMNANLHAQVEQLQQAIIEKNWDALEEMSLMSESRRFWLEALYSKYQSVHIDIAQVATEASEGRAIIHFTKGIRSNGEVVIPNTIGRTIKITIPKNGDEWGRIIW